MGRLIYTPGPDIKFRTGVIGKVTDDPEKTVSGAVASFDDGADDKPLHALSVGIEAVQDLHGYSNPWPGGGGANIWDEQWEVGTWAQNGEKFTDTAIRCKNYIPVTAGTAYYVYFNKSRYTSGLIVRFMDSDKTVLSSTIVGNPGTITAPNDCGYIVFCTFVADNVTTYDNDIAINDPSTVTTYSPYENLCPITGWTEAKIRQAGKNLFVSRSSINGRNNITLAKNIDGSWTINTTGAAADTDFELGNVNDGLSIIKPGTYRISGIASGMWSLFACIKKFSDFENTRYVSQFSADAYADFTLSADEYVFSLIFRIKSGAVLDNVTFYPMIRPVCFIDAAYSPYQGIIVIISFGSAIYGGTADVLNGELTVEKILWTKNTSTMNNSENYPGWSSSGIRDIIGAGLNTVLGYGVSFSNISGVVGSAGDHKNYFAVNTTGNNDVLYLPKDAWNGKTQTEWIADAIDVEIIVPLAEPFTIQLEPETLNTLLGENNIWSDTGDTTVTYPVSVRIPVIIPVVNDQEEEEPDEDDQ